MSIVYAIAVAEGGELGNRWAKIFRLFKGFAPLVKLKFFHKFSGAVDGEKFGKFLGLLLIEKDAPDQKGLYRGGIV